MFNLIRGNYTKVLVYHRVNDYGDPYFVTHVKDFDKQMRFLRTYYKPISIRTYLNHVLDDRDPPRKSVIVSFEDGYEYNYLFAYPILKKYSIPATIFVTTDFVNKKMWMWNDMYRYILENTTLKSFTIVMNDHDKTLDVSDNKGLMEARYIVWKHCCKLARKERLSFLKDMAGHLNVQLPDLPTNKYAALTWDQVKEISRNGIEFGGHTCCHEILSTLPQTSVNLELSNCKKEIEDRIQKEIVSFSYPNGTKKDFNQDIKALVGLQGFKCAFTTIYGINDHQTDLFEIKRIPIGNIDLSDFKETISRLGMVKHRMKRIISYAWPGKRLKQLLGSFCHGGSIY